jgi:hypothetical protein
MAIPYTGFLLPLAVNSRSVCVECLFFKVTEPSPLQSYCSVGSSAVVMHMTGLDVDKGAPGAPLQRAKYFFCFGTACADEVLALI